MPRPSPSMVPLLDALASGPRTSAELQATLGVSQPTVSRLIALAGEQVVRVGHGPATRYAVARALPPLGVRVPMYRVDAQGMVHLLGQLVSLAGGEYWCDFVGHSGVLHPGLPHFLQDMRPQGFMGREFASRFAQELRLPPRLNDWSNEAHLLAMALYGEDLSGNLIVGDESLRRFYVSQNNDWLLGSAEREREYPRRAEAGLTREPGSSAGGEQPKFTAALRDGAVVRHVIVKFSPAGNAASALRWRDLLQAEHLALQVLRNHDIAAARSTLLEAGGRLFLEVERFDRVAAFGRRGLLSLGAVDDHRFGYRDNWSACAHRLLREKVITAADAKRLVLLDAFGALIANTDRHFGNVSLFLDNFDYVLAPAYDMLPMLYRPADSGEIRAREFAPPMPNAVNRDVWSKALMMAQAYWLALQAAPDVSEDFRRIAAENSAVVESLQLLQAPR